MKATDAVIRQVASSDAARLGRFFAAIAEEEALTLNFHPHDFTQDEADRICTPLSSASDIYMIAVAADEVAGYAMLRGWDEGYEVPSFGVCVLPSRQGAGLGSRLLDHALARARDRGSLRVMLKVYDGNSVARRLYEGRGFVLSRLSDDQLVGYLSLDGDPPTGPAADSSG
jgi:GNAT superfamily N-acetyltransferase